MVHRFEDLNIWKEATSLAVEIYRISNKQQFMKDFGLRDQLRRSAVSIASNIAEGKERETAPEFIRYLYIAKGSVGELRTQLRIAHEIGYLTSYEDSELVGKTQKLSGMLGALIKVMKKKLQ